MIFLRVSPVLISLLLIAAHFLRSGFFMLAGVSLAVPLLLFIPKRLPARIVQFCLIAASLEWCRTLFAIAQQRMAAGMPWTRLAGILAGVAVFTGISACVLYMQPLKLRYKLGKQNPADIRS
jgi:hypothetical protein